MLPFVSEAGKSRATQYLMKLVPEIRDAGERARAFAELAPHLSGDEQDAVWLRAVRALDEIAEERERTSAMAQLAPRFPESKVSDLLAVARKISDPASRADVLKALVSRVPDGERLAICVRSWTRSSRSKMPTRVAVHWRVWLRFFPMRW
jgi:hypothetical protein